MHYKYFEILFVKWSFPCKINILFLATELLKSNDKKKFACKSEKRNHNILSFLGAEIFLTNIISSETKKYQPLYEKSYISGSLQYWKQFFAISSYSAFFFLSSYSWPHKQKRQSAILWRINYLVVLIQEIKKKIKRCVRDIQLNSKIDAIFILKLMLFLFLFQNDIKRCFHEYFCRWYQ